MNSGSCTVKMLLAALLGVSLASPALHALDFQPEFVTTQNEDGFKTVEVVLKDGAARVVYCPPVAWKAEDGGHYLRFYPPHLSMADLTIESEKASAARILDA